jgi:hypothetical protein
VVEAERAEHVAVVRDGNRRHPELAHPTAELRQAIGSVEQRVLRVEMEMDEVAGHEIDSRRIESGIHGFILLIAGAIRIREDSLNSSSMIQSLP